MSIERIEIRNQHLKFLKWTVGTFFKNKSISTTGLVLLFNNETVYELITNRLEVEIGNWGNGGLDTFSIDDKIILEENLPLFVDELKSAVDEN
jgi:hypothetical protein